jgi:uroporphyrinogen decarboxylase
VFSAAHDVLRRASGRPGHIFNLGHGVLPTTPLERVQELARYVHRTTARQPDDRTCSAQ